MKIESNFKTDYTKEEDMARKAFRNGNGYELAQSLFHKGLIAVLAYKKTGLEEWDMRIYGAFNAAGGVFQDINNPTSAKACYEFALSSCERVSVGRDPEAWGKNIGHLKEVIERNEKMMKV